MKVVPSVFKIARALAFGMFLPFVCSVVFCVLCVWFCLVVSILILLYAVGFRCMYGVLYDFSVCFVVVLGVFLWCFVVCSLLFSVVVLIHTKIAVRQHTHRSRQAKTHKPKPEHRTWSAGIGLCVTVCFWVWRCCSSSSFGRKEVKFYSFSSSIQRVFKTPIMLFHVAVTWQWRYFLCELRLRV